MSGKKKAVDWLQLSCTTNDPAALEEAFWAVGAQAVTLQDAADHPILEPAPQSTPLWPQVTLRALFDGHEDPRRIQAALRTALAPDEPPMLESELFEDREWTREWLRDFHPQRFGARLWVVPGDESGTFNEPGVHLHLDPGLAFGTGTHPTTALCLEWLGCATVDDCVVLDYGCGSGILAIAALLLGAAHARATDIDPQALAASAVNAKRNGVANRLELHPPDRLRTIRHDLLMANILSGPLIQLAPRLHRLLKPGGQVLLSGVLENQADEVMDGYAAWVDWQPPRTRDGWTCLAGRVTTG